MEVFPKLEDEKCWDGDPQPAWLRINHGKGKETGGTWWMKNSTPEAREAKKKMADKSRKTLDKQTKALAKQAKFAQGKIVYANNQRPVSIDGHVYTGTRHAGHCLAWSYNRVHKAALRGYDIQTRWKCFYVQREAENATAKS